MIKNFLSPEGHQNPISGSKVTAISLKGWILPIGGASSAEGLRLQPAQQACFLMFTLSSHLPLYAIPINDVVLSKNKNINFLIGMVALFGEKVEVCELQFLLN